MESEISEPMLGNVVSLNVSQIKEVEWKGRTITTGIFKEPTNERLEVKGVNIVGDDQADREAHGGINKAIYAYPIEHYDYWGNEFPDKTLPFGMFGENLTTSGLVETEVNVGDKFRVGTTELIAVQPRTPCFKLGIRFGNNSIIKKFSNTTYSGIYFKIHKEGSIQNGDTIERLYKDPLSISIADVVGIYRGESNIETLEKSIQNIHLPEWLRKRIRTYLEENS